MRYGQTVPAFLFWLLRFVNPSHAGSDGDLGVEAHLRSMGASTQAWYIDIRVKETELTVSKFYVNRGNCNVGFSGLGRNMPLTLRFGDVITLATIGCEPLELEIINSAGSFALPLTYIDLSKPVYVRVESPAPNLRRLAFISLSDIKLLKALVNRGNCGDLKYFDLTGDEIRKFGQVYRTGFVPCEPLEVELVTNEGNFTFQF